MLIESVILEISNHADFKIHSSNILHRRGGIEVRILDFEGYLACFNIELDTFLIRCSIVVNEVHRIRQKVVATVGIDKVCQNHTIVDYIGSDVNVLPSRIIIVDSVGSVIV